MIATHLGLSRPERRSQWRHLLKAVAAAPAELPTVVLGDMNEWFPFSATLRDAHHILGEPLAPAAFPSFAPFLALTRIWVRPVGCDAVDQVHRTPLSRRASDHLPVKAVIDVEKFRGACDVAERCGIARADGLAAGARRELSGWRGYAPCSASYCSSLSTPSSRSR